MYIDSLLKQLRTMEGILREKLELDNEQWKQAKRKYGILKVEDLLTGAKVSEKDCKLVPLEADDNDDDIRIEGTKLVN